ncbi:hypothetical protein BCV70DRAFT_209297 [Testicularia cyperi]|uniref:CTLH domain-containing protein n=1 Tax=Testicularia cyperi TaxID=1882483 RepID=A0A317XWV1_9BASI|nr:hypothetical protein BCV70DRAFT_209297 [Testicularia cyperi]
MCSNTVLIGTGTSNGASQNTAEDTDLTSPANLRKLVLNYLIHHCYTETAVAFAKDGITDDLFGTDADATVSSSSAPAQRSKSSRSASRATGPVEGSTSTAATATTSNGSNGGGRQAHPLSAPPLSRDDSSMEIEVENLLPTSSERTYDFDGTTRNGASHRAGNESNGHSNGSPHHHNGSTGRVIITDNDDDENGENAGLDDADADDDDDDDDLDEQEVDISPDLTAQDLRAVRARQQIREHIIAGRIRQAMDLCNTHFPTVLNANAGPSGSSMGSSASSKAAHAKLRAAEAASASNSRVLPANPTSLEPDHLLLNLQIQVFIEAIRSASSSQLAAGAGLGASPQMASSSNLPTLATSTPGIAAAAISRAASPAPSSSSSNGSGTSTTGGNAALNPALHSALAYAQGLYTSAQKLPSYWRAMYLKELEQVTALLAYTDVEHSPVRRFLHRSRKVALAEQVNSAILYRSGKPSQPLIESAVRQTSFLSRQLNLEKVHIPATHPLFSLVSPASSSAYDDHNFASSTTTATANATATATANSASKKLANSRTLPPWDFRTFLAER